MGPNFEINQKKLKTLLLKKTHTNKIINKIIEKKLKISNILKKDRFHILYHSFYLLVSNQIEGKKKKENIHLQ